jgi:hypothetical protein
MRLIFLVGDFLGCLSIPTLAQDVTCYDGTKLRAGQDAACGRHGGVLTPGQEERCHRIEAGLLTHCRTPQPTQRIRRRNRGQPRATARAVDPAGTRGQPGPSLGQRIQQGLSLLDRSLLRENGRTKRGSYTTEAAAKAAGAHASGGKACS